MFDSLGSRHEKLFESYLSDGSADEPALGEMSAALNSCRVQVVNALKGEEQADARRRLKSLYEGLTAVTDYLEQGFHNADVQNETRR